MSEIALWDNPYATVSRICVTVPLFTGSYQVYSISIWELREKRSIRKLCAPGI